MIAKLKRVAVTVKKKAIRRKNKNRTKRMLLLILAYLPSVKNALGRTTADKCKESEENVITTSLY